jgi:hypothetical protein
VIGVVLLLVLLAACLLAARLDSASQAARSRRSPSETVRTALFVADRRVEAEFQRARRAMNDAAGQSWRNLAG